jgi:hypothetical protein
MPKKFGDDRIKKNSTFQMRSGNSPMFKTMGSSPIEMGMFRNRKVTPPLPNVPDSSSWDDAYEKARLEGVDLNELVTKRNAGDETAQSLINYYYGKGSRPVIKKPNQNENKVEVKKEENKVEVKVEKEVKEEKPTRTGKTELTRAIEGIFKSGPGPGGRKIQKGWINPLFRGKNYKGPKDKYAS